jgi:hypothetical protein
LNIGRITLLLVKKGDVEPVLAMEENGGDVM